MDPMQRQNASYQATHMMSVLKDKTKIAVKTIKGEEAQDVEIAVVKATLHDEVVPKEKHVRTLKIACSGSAPRHQVDHIIYKLQKRLKEQGWLVTLKALMVFHRLMREIDPSFQEQLTKFCARTGMHHLLRLDNYSDHTTKETWDYSAWIRVYSCYLDERLEVYRSMKFDPEQDLAGEGAESRLKSCSGQELLERLPKVQRLLSRMLACVPEGAAGYHPIVLQACIWILKESRSIYRAVSEGIMNLADKFFEMERGDAVQALELYRENMVLNDKLNAYFAAVQSNGSLRGSVTFPTLQSLPADFLTTMEDFVKDMPRTMDAAGPGSSRRTGPLVGNKASSMVARGGLKSAAFAGGSVGVNIPMPKAPEAEAPPSPKPEPKPAPPPEIDLLSLDDPEPMPMATPSPQPAAKPDPLGLDALAFGMTSPATTTSTADATSPAPANGFGDNAFGAPQQPGFGEQPAFGYQPQMTGMDYYQQQQMMMMNPYGMGGMGMAPPGMSMALVPVNPMGMPGMGMGYPGMGMPGSNPFGMPPAGPGMMGHAAPPPQNSNNPFANGGANLGRRLTNDPLNGISDDLFGAKPEKTATPSPPMNSMRQNSLGKVNA